MLRRHWKALAWLVVILGFLTLLPINVGKPNFFGSFTLCSFAPIATIAMFIIALTIYSFVKKRKLLLYGNVALLLVIVGFTGFWVYDAKLPMDSIEMRITNVRFWIGEDPHWIDGKPANLSSIFFDVTLYNPTSRDVPAFHSENYALRINDRLISYPNYEMMDVDVEIHEPLRAYSTQNVTWMEVVVEKNHTDPDVWSSLFNKSFTFTISGVLVARYYYAPSSLDEYARREYSIVWASRPYSVSYTYRE